MKKLYVALVVYITSLGISHAQCGPGQDTTPPVIDENPYGIGTQANPFNSFAQNATIGYPNGVYYFAINGNTFQAQLDNTTDGGGWILILNYVHESGTNPNVQVRSTDLPLLGASQLGTDESGTTSWGHLSNSLAADIDFEEVRFYGQTNAHNRVIDFKTDYPNVLNYIKTGTGSFAGINNPANHTLYSQHTAFIPQQASNTFTNQNDLALTNFPFWRGGRYHWGIQGLGNRWEVDDFAQNNASTIHQVWARGDASPSNSGGVDTITLELDATGNATASPSDFGLIVTDNCTLSPIITISQTNFNCNDLGTNTIQYIATDDEGNQSSADVTVIVRATNSLTISCPANQSVTNDPGLCGAIINYMLPTASTICGPETPVLIAGLPSGSLFPVGTTVNTYEVSIPNGITTTCSFNITVTDTEVPIANCNDITISLNNSGLAEITPSDILGYSVNQNGIFNPTDISATGTSVVLNNNEMSDGLPIGFNFNFYGIEYTEFYISTNGFITFTDSNNPGSSSGQFLPSPAPSNNLIALAWEFGRPGNGGQPLMNEIRYKTEGTAPNRILIVEYFNYEQNNTLSPITTQAKLFENTNIIEIHTTSVLSDGSRHTMGIEDQNGILANPVPGRNQANWSATNDFVSFTPHSNFSSDNCGITSISIDQIEFDCSNLGANTVTMTLSDAAGNTSSCSSTVTVVDPNAPIIRTNDITLALDVNGMASIVTDDLVPTNTQYLIDQNGTFAPIDIATNGIEVILEDDEVSPALPIGFDFNFYGNDYAEFYISSNGFITFNNDDDDGCCDGMAIPNTNTPNNFIALAWEDLDSDNGGQPAINVIRYETIGTSPNRILIVEYFMVDHFPSDNNVTTQVQLKEGNDHIEIHTTAMPSDGGDHTMGIENSSGTHGISVPGRNAEDWSAFNDFVAFIPPGRYDNCGIANISLDITDFDCNDLGDNTVTITAIDTSGNSTSETAIVTIEDTITPTVVCQNFTAQLDVNGTVVITETDVDGGSTDNCSMVFTLSQDTFDCSDVGSPISIDVTAEDTAGNSAMCTTLITIEDAIAPDVVCQNITVALDGTGQATITATEIDNGTTDACGIDTMVLDIDTFDCSHIGTNSVSLTVTDIHGNTASCIATVTVEDITSATIISGPTDIFTGTGINDTQCATIVNYNTITVDNFIIQDNCGITTPTSVIQTGGLGSGALFPVGMTIEEYTLTDASGNETTYSFIVSVTDTTIPIIDCPADIVVSGDTNGTYIIEDYSNLVQDNCTASTNLIINQVPVAGTVVTNPSTIPISITAIDVAGNVSECSFDLIVDETLSVADNSFRESSIQLYPNPARQTIFIDTKGVEIDGIEIYDLRGRKVKEFAPNATTHSYEVAQLENAVYFVRIQKGQHIIIKRFIKKG